jgi:hypothetical protein
MPSNGKKVIKNKVNLLLARLQNATLVHQPNEDKGRDITLYPDLNKHLALHNPQINLHQLSNVCSTGSLAQHPWVKDLNKYQNTVQCVEPPLYNQAFK